MKRTEERLDIDVTSPFGIGKATVQRETKQWPKSVVVRLRLKGLESFKVRVGDRAIEWSASADVDTATRVTLRQGKEETPQRQTSPYFTPVRYISEGAGYFQVIVPQKLLESNPSEIQIEWIDFYRS